MDEVTLFLAELPFFCGSLYLQSILIDACVLDSDSGLLQQVQASYSYLLFTLIHRYLMLDSLMCFKALNFFKPEKETILCPSM